MRMRVEAMRVLLVSLVAGEASAQGSPCELNPDSGGTGCIPGSVSVIHAKATSGGIDFTGSDYENTCSTQADCGSGPCTQLQPMLRFWEYDDFFARNSASADQLQAGTPWMINPNLDGCGARPETGVWVLFQPNWGNNNVKGCITSGRVVAEVSFKDTTTGKARYAIGSVRDPTNSFYDFDLIKGANGADANIVPLTDVALITSFPQFCPGPGCNVAGGFATLTIDLSGELKWYTEVGADDPATPLIRGIEVLYKIAAAMPNTTGPGLTGGWLPVLDPANTAQNLGPIATPGTGKQVAIPDPIVIPAWLTARVIYADTAAGCGVGDPCLNPQGLNAPASCYRTVVGPVSRFLIEAVSFAKLRATRTASHTVTISWSTTVESGTVGFVVKRAPTPRGPYAQVGSFTFATGSGSDYRVTDSTAAPEKPYWYQIVETAAVGTGSVGGPIELAAVGAAGAGGRSRRPGIGVSIGGAQVEPRR